MKSGKILRIEKISPHDGSGLRTVVFLKGCPLRCAWCSTPESHAQNPELFYKKAKCGRCGHCIQRCPQKALSFSGDGSAIIRNRKICIECFQCAEVCPRHALGVYGQIMTVEQVMEEIRKESLFYFFSKGGVTLSGGDVLCQVEFACEILKSCREECINTSAELDLYGPYENVENILRYLDSYYVDLKLIDGDRHKKWTGCDNHSILRNLLKSSVDFPQKPLYVRVPLIPGINDNEENIRETVAFCKRLLNCRSLEFLPYHRLGVSTYQYICRAYAFPDLEAMTDREAVQRICRFIPEKLPFKVLVSGKQLIECD